MFLSKNTQNLTFSFSHSQRNQRKGTWLDPQCWTLSKGSFAQEDPVLKSLSHTQPCMAKSQSPAVGICPASSSATSGSPTTHKFDCTPGGKIDWSLVSCLLIGWPHNKASSFLKPNAIVLASVGAGKWALYLITYVLYFFIFFLVDISLNYIFSLVFLFFKF